MNYEYCNGYTYTIKQGDTLYEISKKLEVPLALILRSNPYVDVFNLQIGDTLCIPAKDRPVSGPDRPPMLGPDRPPMPGPDRPPMLGPDRPPMLGPDRPPMPGSDRPSMPESDRPLVPGSDRPSMRPGLPSTDRPLPPPSAMTPSQMIPSQMIPSQMVQSDSEEVEDSWIRYVVQPGDTLSELIRNPECLQAVLEKNGVENMYLLPGIAYYVPER